MPLWNPDVPCRTCGHTVWYHGSDPMSGSGYAQCMTCWHVYWNSPRGWVDRSLGVVIEHITYPGSWYSKSLSSRYFDV